MDSDHFLDMFGPIPLHEAFITTQEFLGHTQDEVSQLTGLSRPTVNKFAAGKAHKPATGDAIRQYIADNFHRLNIPSFGTHADQFMKDPENVKPSKYRMKIALRLDKVSDACKNAIISEGEATQKLQSLTDHLVKQRFKAIQALNASETGKSFGVTGQELSE